MQTFLKFSFNVTDFFFKNWTVESPAGFAGLCFGLLIVSILLHVIKEFHGVHYDRCIQSLVAKHRPNPDLHCDPQFLHLSIFVHGIHSTLYIIQVIVEYAIMLSIMKFNGWFLIAVILGGGLGYFIISAFVPAHVDYMTVDAASTLSSCDQNSPSTSSA